MQIKLKTTLTNKEINHINNSLGFNLLDWQTQFLLTGEFTPPRNRFLPENEYLINTGKTYILSVATVLNLISFEDMVQKEKHLNLSNNHPYYKVVKISKWYDSKVRKSSKTYLSEIHQKLGKHFVESIRLRGENEKLISETKRIKEENKRLKEKLSKNSVEINELKIEKFSLNQKLQHKNFLLDNFNSYTESGYKIPQENLKFKEDISETSFNLMFRMGFALDNFRELVRKNNHLEKENKNLYSILYNLSYRIVDKETNITTLKQEMDKIESENYNLKCENIEQSISITELNDSNHHLDNEKNELYSYCKQLESEKENLELKLNYYYNKLGGNQ